MHAMLKAMIATPQRGVFPTQFLKFNLSGCSEVSQKHVVGRHRALTLERCLLCFWPDHKAGKLPAHAYQLLPS